jgi:hypothetical protein
MDERTIVYVFRWSSEATEQQPEMNLQQLSVSFSPAVVIEGDVFEFLIEPEKYVVKITHRPRLSVVGFHSG